METRAKILVVDDDLDIGTVLKMMLSYNGYEVTTIINADKTKETLSNQHFDLLILDMLISGINGTDVCRKMKSDSSTAEIPVLMISALSDAEPVCRQAGADDFISKPFDMRAIINKVNNLIKTGHKKSKINS